MLPWHRFPLPPRRAPTDDRADGLEVNFHRLPGPCASANSPPSSFSGITTPRTKAAPTMLSDSRHCGFAFMSRTAAGTSAIRTLREIFRMRCSRSLKNSDWPGAEARCSARIRLLVTPPRTPIRISPARATFGQACVRAGIRWVRYSPEKSSTRPEPPAIQGTPRQRSSQAFVPLGKCGTPQLKLYQAVDA